MEDGRGFLWVRWIMVWGRAGKWPCADWLLRYWGAGCQKKGEKKRDGGGERERWERREGEREREREGGREGEREGGRERERERERKRGRPILRDRLWWARRFPYTGLEVYRQSTAQVSYKDTLVLEKERELYLGSFRPFGPIDPKLWGVFE